MWINKDDWRDGLPPKEDQNEQKFSTLESEVKLLLAEMNGFIENGKGTDAPTRLEEEINGKIREMENVVTGMPTITRPPYNRRIQTLKSERYKLASQISPEDDTAQRGRLLRSTGKLNSSSQKLDNSHRLAHENEAIGTEVLNMLRKQREQIEGTRETLGEAEGSVDKSLRTLKDMGK